MSSRPTIRVIPSAPASAARAPEPAQRRALTGALLLAPHRLAFFAGVVMLLLVSAWWTWQLVAPHFGAQIVTPLPLTLVHGLAFASGFMPLFMCGFMFTAGPRWLDVDAPPARALRWPVLLHVAGVVLLIVGAATRSGVTAFGALLLALSWSVVGVSFAAMLKRSRVRDQLHARCVLGFWIFGIASALLAAGALAVQEVGIAAVAVSLMVFAFVVPITVTVAHRLLPFFTSSAVSGLVPWRPNWVLGLLLVGVLVFGAVQVLARVGPAADRSLAWLTLATMAPAAAALTALSIQWGLTQSLRGVSLRLLAMLHLAFLWIPIALLLAAIDAALLLVWGDAAPRLGLMPLHALTVGFLGSMLFAMATRVIRGHGGLAVIADQYVWVLFWALQATALLRLAAPIYPTFTALLASAAVAWLAVWAAWAARMLPVLWRPRADGRPG